MERVYDTLQVKLEKLITPEKWTSILARSFDLFAKFLHLYFGCVRHVMEHSALGHTQSNIETDYIII